jgi:zinc transporter, ZIP family
MSVLQTILLGAIAGFTIFLGLPIGRLRTTSRTVRCFLNGVSAGILVFLLFDILEHAIEPLEEAVTDRTWGRVASLSAVLVVGFGLGMLGLLYLGRRWRRGAPRTVRSSLGPGAMAVAEAERARLRSNALRVAMSIAAGIGLHNFSEGLAIGQAASADKVSLALLLVIGFSLHNATEGFGIVGPLAAAGERASWGWLALAGVVGGGPTVLGTIIGTSITSELLFVACLALAAGAILYVVDELLAAGRRMSWDVTSWGVFVGFVVALATELVIVAAGA